MNHDRPSIPLTPEERFAFLCIVLGEFVASGRMGITSEYRQSRPTPPGRSYHRWDDR